MIDFNNQKEVERLRKIANYPEFKEFKDFINYQIETLNKIEDVDSVEELMGRKIAIKTLNNILDFIIK